ncbi:MAG: site-2 protease family protein [Kofleriaceae bacterium]
MDLSPQQIRWILVSVFVLVISVALHEFGHAFMAYKLGDDTPKRQGRVTLNPIAHVDPIGTLLLPVIGGIYGAAGGGGGGFGWGKPVQWQPHRIRKGIRMATANILVSFAGPFMNLVLAVVIATVHSVLAWQGVITRAGDVGSVLAFAVGTNFVLFFFNLLPVPPLDGGHIAQAFMPYRHRDKYDTYAKFGPFVILAIMLIPQIRQVFLVPALWCTQHLYALFGM